MEKVATRDAYGKTLVGIGRENKNIVVLDADLSKSTKTADFAKEFPDRFFNMGIAEQNLLGVAAGFSLAGKIPFASSFAIFATGRAFEIIRNSIAYPALNVKIAATHAGLTVGEDGASHQALEDIAIMRALPQMTVLVPADGVETAKAVEAAVRHQGPVYLRLGRPALPLIFDEQYDFKIGRAVRLAEGDQCTIIACGVEVIEALEAAKDLQSQGIKIRVVNMATVKPLDKGEIVAAARDTGAVVTAEEHNVIGGLGSAVAEVLVREYPVPLEMVGVEDRFGESGKPAELLEKYGLTKKHLVAAVKRVISRKK